MQDAHKRFVAKVPSNIAFIKYWGKKDSQQQLPANDSLSMTLSTATTTTTACPINGGTHEVYFRGQRLFESDAFAKKIYSHLKTLASELSVKQALRIETQNSYPDSCGIASSASGFGALTLAATAAWTNSADLNELESKGFYLSKLARLARLGSGSACRSLFGGFVHWQTSDSADFQKVEQCWPDSHWDLADIVVLVNTQKKAISSSQGHQSAWSSPLFRQRLAVIPERVRDIKKAIASRDLDSLGRIIETEATEMHAIMLSSRPASKYYGEATSQFLAWVRAQRYEGFLPAYFTIDAGPNVHLICEQERVEAVATKIAANFPEFELLIDRVGAGPSLAICNEQTF